MKKIIVILMMFILCGCKDSMNVPKNTVETIDTSKHKVAIVSTGEYLTQAEVQYTSDMMYSQEKDCYSVQELNVKTSAKDGKVCYKSGAFVAQNITFDEFVCNEKKNEVKCEALNDK